MNNYVTMNVYEIINKISTAKTKQEKVKLLKEHESWALKDLLRCIYDDTIQFLLPGGTPPYTPHNISASPAPNSFNRLHKNLTYYVKGGQAEKIKSYKREKMFIDMLESVHPDESVLLIDMMNKKPVKGITKKLVEEAYPNLIKK